MARQKKPHMYKSGRTGRRPPAVVSMKTPSPPGTGQGRSSPCRCSAPDDKISTDACLVDSDGKHTASVDAAAAASPACHLQQCILNSVFADTLHASRLLQRTHRSSVWLGFDLAKMNSTVAASQRKRKRDQPCPSVVRTALGVLDAHLLRDDPFGEAVAAAACAAACSPDVLSGARVAIKVLRRTDEAESELRLWRTLHHPHLVPLEKEVWHPVPRSLGIDGRCVAVTMPYSNVGDLNDVTGGYDDPLDGPASLHVARSVLAALVYLHDVAGVVHRDLKLENVFLHASDESRARDTAYVRSELHAGRCLVRLGDFDTARRCPPGPHAHSCVTGMAGTLVYMAPEVLAREPYGTPADLWSFAVLMHYCVAGIHPYDEHRNSAWYNEKATQDEHDARIVDNVRLKRQHVRGLPRGIPASFETGLRQCLAYRASIRPSAAELQKRLPPGK